MAEWLLASDIKTVAMNRLNLTGFHSTEIPVEYGIESIGHARHVKMFRTGKTVSGVNWFCATSRYGSLFAQSFQQICIARVKGYFGKGMFWLALPLSHQHTCEGTMQMNLSLHHVLKTSLVLTARRIIIPPIQR